MTFCSYSELSEMDDTKILRCGNVVRKRAGKYVRVCVLVKYTAQIDYSELWITEINIHSKFTEGIFRVLYFIHTA